MKKIESVVIVKWPAGYVATLRFSDSKYDKIFSSSNRGGIYSILTNYIKTVPND